MRLDLWFVVPRVVLSRAAQSLSLLVVPSTQHEVARFRVLASERLPSRSSYPVRAERPTQRVLNNENAIPSDAEDRVRRNKRLPTSRQARHAHKRAIDSDSLARRAPVPTHSDRTAPRAAPLDPLALLLLLPLALPLQPPLHPRAIDPAHKEAPTALFPTHAPRTVVQSRTLVDDGEGRVGIVGREGKVGREERLERNDLAGVGKLEEEPREALVQRRGEAAGRGLRNEASQH